MKVIHIESGDVIKCSGCKGDNWIIIQQNAKSHNKYICNKCGNEHTLYTYPPKYKHG